MNILLFEINLFTLFRVLCIELCAAFSLFRLVSEFFLYGLLISWPFSGSVSESESVFLLIFDESRNFFCPQIFYNKIYSYFCALCKILTP